MIISIFALLLPVKANSSHELLYPEHSTLYSFGKIKQIDVNFECLNDGAKSSYSKMYNISGYKTQIKIENGFKSKKYWMLGPSLNLTIDFSKDKIIKSKEEGYNSKGNKIISLFEVLETDSKNRTTKAKSYQYYENIEDNVNGSTEAKETSKVLADDENDDVLNYSFDDSIGFSKGLNGNNKTKDTESYEFTIYEFKKEYREVVETLHEYTYYNKLYVQKDIPIEGHISKKHTMVVNEVAVETSSTGQKISEMFKEPTNGAIVVKLENTYDKNNRLIYTKSVNGYNMRFQYYENGLLKRVTQEGVLGTINYILKYEYPKIDHCGNPIFQRIKYIVPSIRDNKKVPSYCPNMERKFSYKYYETC